MTPWFWLFFDWKIHYTLKNFKKNKDFWLDLTTSKNFCYFSELVYFLIRKQPKTRCQGLKSGDFCKCIGFLHQEIPEAIECRQDRSLERKGLFLAQLRMFKKHIRQCLRYCSSEITKSTFLVKDFFSVLKVQNIIFPHGCDRVN